MIKDPKRERFFELLNAHLDGDTSGDAELRALIAEDRGLYREFSLAMTVADGLKNMPPADPPADFTGHVMTAVEAQREPWFAAVISALRSRPALRLGFAAAFSAFVLIAGFWLGRLSVKHAGLPAPQSLQPGADSVPVKFVFHAPQAGDVRVVGDFNSWDKESTPLRKNPDGSWTIEIAVKPGRYNYLFLVDGKRWSIDPSARAAEDDGFGKRNSVLEI